MTNFKHVKVTDLTDNFFKGFADDWTLITAMKPGGGVNTMTASWGGIGHIWSKPVFSCVIRPQRYTFEFAESAGIITLSFFGGDYRKALNLCGTRSGRDLDKISASGLSLIKDGGAAYFSEASLVLVGRKVYADRIKKECFLDPAIPEETYAAGDYHKIYFCTIEDVLVKT
jgi:flavin reductase (DIM6/NTAB) family NADH-FMN oxidoreductase RutF